MLSPRTRLAPGDDWDRRCWLQPVRYRARTATDRLMTCLGPSFIRVPSRPEARSKSLSRKGSLSDPQRQELWKTLDSRLFIDFLDLPLLRKKVSQVNFVPQSLEVGRKPICDPETSAFFE